LMDLAMPGIDGWETIRRLRAAGHADAQIAIVSANAFERGQDNDAGIRPEDFIVKPVRHSELLDWLERRLSLVWVDEPALQVPQQSAPAVPLVELLWPREAHVQALAQVVSLGYFRGVMNKLNDIEADQPECVSFVLGMRELARQFQFEAMSQRLAQVPSSSQSPPNP